MHAIDSSVLRCDFELLPVYTMQLRFLFLGFMKLPKKQYRKFVKSLLDQEEEEMRHPPNLLDGIWIGLFVFIPLHPSSLEVRAHSCHVCPVKSDLVRSCFLRHISVSLSYVLV